MHGVTVFHLDDPLFLTRVQDIGRISIGKDGSTVAAGAISGEGAVGNRDISAGGNRARAARLLGLSYKAFLYRLEKHSVS